MVGLGSSDYYTFSEFSGIILYLQSSRKSLTLSCYEKKSYQHFNLDHVQVVYQFGENVHIFFTTLSVLLEYGMQLTLTSYYSVLHFASYRSYEFLKLILSSFILGSGIMNWILSSIISSGGYILYMRKLLKMLIVYTF